MALYDDAKRILKNENARLAQDSEGIYDNNTFVIFWDEIEAKRVNECVNYLNSDDASVVEGPIQFYDVLVSDRLYHLHAYYDEENQRLYRVLMRNPIEYSADNWGAATTRWKLSEGQTFEAGQTQRVLIMRNVSVEAAIDFEGQSLDESYTDAIYLINETTPLSGEWFSIKRRADEDPKTGLYTLRWFLSKYHNKDAYFYFRAAPDTIKGFFYKYEATQDTLNDLMDTYRFESDGSWDEALASGTSKTLQTEVVGRTVVMRRTARDEQDLFFDAEIEITWNEARYFKDTATAVSAQGTTVPRFGVAHAKQWYEFGKGTTMLPTVSLIDFDLDDGLYRTITDLTGIDGGTLRPNEDGTFDWRLSYDYFEVPNTDWYISQIAREWVKKEIPITTSWQQIRRRVGGDLEFNKSNAIDPATGRALSTQILSGIEWNLDFEWRDDTQYSADYCIYHEGTLYTVKTGVTTTAGQPPDGTGSADWDVAGSAPSAWYDYGYYARYGDWKTYWRKGVLTGTGAIRAHYDDAITCLGKYSEDTFYNPTSNAYSGMLFDNPDWGNPNGFPVVYNSADGKFYRLKLKSGVSAHDYNTTYNPGDVVTAVARSNNGNPGGMCVYTCTTTTTGYFGGTTTGWAAGIAGETLATSDWWVEYDDDYIVSNIALAGSGVLPFNDAAQVGVINEEGENAQGSNTRVSFYTNPHENPEYFVAGQRLRRYEDTIVLRTYFAVEPWRVTNPRIPQGIDELVSPYYHKDDPNIRVSYKEIELRRGELWCIEMTITRFGEWEADQQTNSSFENNTLTDGNANADGDLRNFPYVDENGYWSLYHRIPSVGTYTGDASVTGQPSGTFKDVG